MYKFWYAVDTRGGAEKDCWESEGECEKQFTDTNTSPTLKTICSIFTPVAGLKMQAALGQGSKKP
jgi:hypothetical protein